MSIGQEIKQSFKQGSLHTKLIYVNIGVFLAVSIVNVIMLISGNRDYFSLLEWLQVPSYLPHLISTPWTLVTYMFTHENLFHILFNLLALYWFGQIFLRFFTQKQLLSTYLWGGLAGGILFVLAFNAIPLFVEMKYLSVMIGASASIMAITFAAATYAPNHTIYLLFFGEVRLKYIALVYLIIDLISIAGTNAGGHIAHLGGALAGYLIALKLKQNSTTNLGLGWVEGIFNVFSSERNKMKVVHKRNMSDMEYNATKVKRESNINDILDKINKTGYESLTKEEREELFKLGNKN
ncbi:rhomboid family intramembrane serine protease [Williamwhitmania taraxaci]|uniref:Membrane associated serine protease, rhomboid family n=1 Tax=Williamwhitmania taraxaci TaxID=1640674 RepID=A0A1G6KSY6_9BACT|nr:rhomboid family intramembrane serine protease [Williamwhitmania taraxaci]SDC33486.1 Membrane associated serine protease, rhomboid family [Williamwhitmania taraxaci]